MKIVRMFRVPVLMMFGDCSRRGCGHSLAYHVPLVGCMKCGCDEYK